MSRDDDSLRAPYRPVRPIGAPQDGPWPGMLTCLPSGERRLFVDAAVVGADWLGWTAARDGHVLAPIDVVRRHDGHDVVLPLCTERVSDHLARRRGPAALAPGEAVTLGVSILRGCGELLDEPSATGEWWLTDDGRPVFATDAATRGLFDGAAALLAELSAAAPHTDAWSDAIDAIATEHPTPTLLERAEHGLFAVAAALPVNSPATAVRGAREVTATPAGSTTAAEEPAPRSPLWAALARHVDGDVADLVSRATTAVWRRARAPRPGRRAPWLVGGAVAGVVLCAGFLWPTGDGDPASADAAGDRSLAGQVTATPTATPAPSPSADPDDGQAAASTAPVDLVSVTGTLLDARRACGGDGDCLGGVQQDPQARFDGGPIDLPADERKAVLLDDFGGVAVLRIDSVAEGAVSQLVVIARTDDEWLLRDVHDVTQQP